MRVRKHKARKEFVDVHGGKIMPGDTYYQWAAYRSPIKRSKTPPSKAESTGNERQAALYDAEESIAKALTSFTDRPCREEAEELSSVLSSAASEIEDVAGEYEESADNIESAFSSSETADQCRERADHIHDLSGQLENAAADLDSALEDEKISEDDLDAALDTVQAAIDNLDFDLP